jgi:cytochrome c oxidase cbb3-type subunit III
MKPDASSNSENANSAASSPPEARIVHEVDGIQEYDNALPRWWLTTLYATMAFAVVYWFVFEAAKIGDSPEARFAAEVAKKAEAEAARIKASGAVTPEALTMLAKDKTTVEQGRAMFVQTCAACHRQDGGGNVGPNLTDEFWLHGGAPEKIFATIGDGVPDKGMPAWKPQLGVERVQAVTAFVLTLRNTNVPGGKQPQGERERLASR